MPKSNDWLTSENNQLKNDGEEKKPNVWDVLAERKKKGLWDGEITTHQIVEHKITEGPHYYELTNIRKREVTCTSCPVRHGGILEAKLLTRYAVKDGIIYLDGKPTNTVPEKGH